MLNQSMKINGLAISCITRVWVELVTSSLIPKIEPFLKVKLMGLQSIFSKFLKDKHYIYQGPVELIDEPYQQKEKDEKNNLRTVWVFPVKLKAKNSAVTLTEIIETSKTKQRKLRKKTLEQLSVEAEATAKNDVGYRNTFTKYYIRSDSIVQLAKRLANGICQLCEQAAPFFGQKW